MSFGAFAPLPLRLTSHADGWSAEQHARACADMVAMVSTMPFAVITFHTGNFSIASYIGQHGFERPVVGPTSFGDNSALVTWQRSYRDPLGESAPTMISAAVACASVPAGGVTARVVVANIIAPNVVHVRRLRPDGVVENRAVTLVVY
jgi:hypothetical protein